MAICASVCPRDAAISLSARTWPSVRSLSWSDDSDPFRDAREPSGIPPRYFFGQHALRQRGERDAADAELAERVEQPALDPPVDHRVRRLVDQQRRAERLEDLVGLPRPLRRVRRDARVQRPARPHGRVERAHRLLERRVRVEPVRVEDVDVLKPHPLQRLVEAGEQVLARAPFAVRPRPHVVPGLGGDDQLVPVRPEVLAQQPPEVDLSVPVGRPVVVRQVEVGDAEVEGAAQDRPLHLDRRLVAEVLPQPERHRGQLQPAPPARGGRASCRRTGQPAAR